MPGKDGTQTMFDLTSRRTATCLALLSFIGLGVSSCDETPKTDGRPAPVAKVETREYTARSGHALAITSLGGIVGMRGPKVSGANSPPIRGGYKLTYKHPHDGRQVVAFAAAEGGEGAAGSSNLVPVSFEASPSGTSLTDAEPLTAKVTVQTGDGLLRLTHLLVWEPGSDTVSVQTEVANSDAKQAASVVAFERTIDVSGEGSVAKNQVARDVKNQVAREWSYTRLVRHDPRRNDVYVMDLGWRCSPLCPPPPPFMFRVTGEPSHIMVVRQPPADPSAVAQGRAEVAKVSKAAGKQPDGAPKASLVWEFNSPSQLQTPMVFTTRFAPQDAATR
jgi:hypothetical protein